MSKKQFKHNVPRWQVGGELARMFLDDYKEIMFHYELAQQIEITEHLQGLIGASREFNREEAAWYKELHLRENALLKKYGKTLKPYTEKQFHKYFDWASMDWALHIYTAEEFNHLPEAEKLLTETDIHNFLSAADSCLYYEHMLLCLQKEPEFGDTKPLEDKQQEDTELNDKNITRARQLLLVYYFLKTFGIEHRDSTSVSAVARFIHGLTGTKFTTIQNSDIYKKYLLMPNYKKGEQLIADLNFIRSYFEEIGIAGAVKEIDDEINRAIEELPLGARKKYRNS